MDQLDILSNLFATNSKKEFDNYLIKNNYTLETKLDSTYNPLLFELFWSRGDFEWLITTHAFNPDIRDLQGRTFYFLLTVISEVIIWKRRLLLLEVVLM